MSELKKLARQIFDDTLAGLDVSEALLCKFPRTGSLMVFGGAEIDLAAYRRIRAVAVGKAAVAMARALVRLLEPDFSAEGLLVAPHSALAEVPGFRAFGAGHPLPDHGSLAAAHAILDLLAGCDDRTLVFFLLSGGGSALVELPLDSRVTLPDLQTLYRLLVGCGAPIGEINAVRKHLSAVKGGRLAAAAPAATKLTLAITDVPNGKESALASGPTLPDPTTIADACAVIDRYALLPKLPAPLRRKFEHPDELQETPKPGDPAFARARFALLLGLSDLFHHAHRATESRGFLTICDNSTDDWPLAPAAAYLLDELAKLRRSAPGRRVAVISDGELSSPVNGDGVGGRNSAWVLECAERIAGENVAVFSAGTDGLDGSSPAAGAVADGETLSRARAARLDPRDFARRSDSYNFFDRLGDSVMTGPTGNNLRDLRILLAD